MDTCQDCIWNDKCNSSEPCDNFYPADNEDVIALREYEQDLRERAEIYLEIIEEQDS